MTPIERKSIIKILQICWIFILFLIWLPLYFAGGLAEKISNYSTQKIAKWENENIKGDELKKCQT